VACRSQNNPRRTVPDGVPPGAANLGFRRFFLSKAVRPAVLTTARSSVFVRSTEKASTEALHDSCWTINRGAF
jgi:hypothetical protein